ncbi:MAG: hypothetical protein COA57_07465 [Flavobacteriales bacterium]|nr:MAG: hypothetical protein COA57_07465 [Flavobacteriales bacterium]
MIYDLQMKKWLNIGFLMLLSGMIFAQSKTIEFTVEGMTCGNCANTVQQALTKLEGVENATVDFPTKKATVVAKNVTHEQLRKTVADANFEAIFSGEEMVKPLSDEDKKRVDIETIKGGNKIKIKDHLTEGKITIFDFYADWCGPCRVFSPKVEQMLLRHKNLVLKKVDVVSWKSSLSKQLTKEYQFPALPFTLIFDDKGNLLGRVEGNHIEQVEEIIKSNMK